MHPLAALFMCYNESREVFMCRTSLCFTWGYSDRDRRLGAVHCHREQDLASGQDWMKLLSRVFQLTSMTLHDPAETIWYKLLHRLQSTWALTGVPLIFFPVLCTSRKDYKVSMAQKQQRGAWLIPTRGLRAAWGAKVRLKVALSHPSIPLVLHQFLTEHTLDLFLSFIAMFCHF